MRRSLTIVIVILFSGWSNLARAQFNVKDSVVKGFLVGASYAAELPGGDLAKVFGWNSNVQIDVEYKTKSNWEFGAQGAFLFGDVLRKSVLDSLATSDGNLISNDGTYPSISYFERGYDIQLSVAKLFPFKKPNPNSGILVRVSAGYLRHHIRIQDNNWTPQIDSNYTQGYEQLSEGVCVTEFIGYQYLGNHRMANFFAGFEFTQGFTKNLQYNFEEMRMDNSTKYDLLSGFRIGWILPIYQQESTRYYTY
jgi:hypothetical protein